MHALEIKNLEKIYEGGVRALKGIDLTVQQGDFFALLGPNGAGKSTTIGIISSLVRKTKGKVSICGIDIDKNFSKARTKIGLVAQEFNLPVFERVWDVVTQQAGLYGIPMHIAKKRAKVLLKQLDLWGKHKSTIRSLSGGMKRRVMIATAMIHEPELLILDEPTAGVDIELRRGLYEYLENLNKAGTTIILTTHYLEEAERLCNQIAIIDHGQVVLNIPKRELSQRIQTQYYVVEVEGDIPESLPNNVKRRSDAELEVTLNKGESLTKLFSIIESNGMTVNAVQPAANRLEQLFVELTHREVSDDA